MSLNLSDETAVIGCYVEISARQLQLGEPGMWSRCSGGICVFVGIECWLLVASKVGGGIWGEKTGR